jgi:hypothetical protein
MEGDVIMSKLSNKEKKDILAIKTKISQNIFTVAKIQDISLEEQKLMQMAMEYISTDRIGDYDGRMNELYKYNYMIYGILYNHLYSKQIRFGNPSTLGIAYPFANAQSASMNNYYSTSNYDPYNDDAF